MTLEYMVAGVCGVCLLAIVAALIFDSSFRSDLTAQPGKVSIVGISVEGVIIVLLSALMVGGLLYSLDKYSSRIAIAEQQNIPSIKLSELPFTAKNAAEAIERIGTLIRSDAAKDRVDVVNLVRALKYHQPESAQIRKFQALFTGPWGIADQAQEKHLTVPMNIKRGEVRGCPDQLGKKYEIRSRPLNEDGAAGESVEVTVTALITKALDCEQRYSIIQVSCDVAQSVFSESVVSCDKKGQPKWTPNESKKPIWLTQTSA